MFSLSQPSSHLTDMDINIPHTHIITHNKRTLIYMYPSMRYRASTSYLQSNQPTYLTLTLTLLFYTSLLSPFLVLSSSPLPVPILCCCCCCCCLQSAGNPALYLSCRNGRTDIALALLRSPTFNFNDRINSDDQSHAVTGGEVRVLYHF